MLKSIIDQKRNINAIITNDFLTRKKHKVAGIEMTLDHLENDIIRKGFGEFRIHFLLSCGAKSCSRWPQKATTEANVREMIESSEKTFLLQALAKRSHTQESQLFTIPLEKKWEPKFLKKLRTPWRGNKRAKVVVYIVSDFQSPFCSRMEKTLKKLDQEYGDRVRFNFVNYPHYLKIAHLAAIAAARQGKFWEMHDRIFALQEIKTKITQQALHLIAKDIGLKMKRYERDRQSKRTKAKLRKDIEMAEKAGVNGTPTFSIDGKKLVGIQSIEDFRTVFDQALKKKSVKTKPKK